MQFHRPETLESALVLMADRPVRILAGGTDFFPALGGKTLCEPVIDLSRVDGLSGIMKQDDLWRFGATTTWAHIAKADLPAMFDGLRQAAREVGSIQIQNAGTVAGNLCNASPAADGVPPLLSLDAQVEISGGAGVRVLPLSKFITGVRKTELRPGELVTAILVPDRPKTCSAFLKLGARRYLVISIAMVAVALELDAAGTISGLGIAVGACSAVATRLPGAEARLIGVTPDPVTLKARLGEEDLEGLAPIDDVRARASYRRNAARELICRAIVKAARGGA
ncbi:CO/xanthine dehydrogenase FAD-binding subunit [Breoghania corrubedonensis]|uniref:CO/xanthine dehydrogenase FAD-binding subunit n=1 Tax=Breoghania corrubedonensis TaxID=665038 RepID=A0A2T5V5N5_9HYPH|nr:xanthine dehydrogenase family protein subunit M [Breoghania corrubedonensis]PTW59036.1 CO/xanthine dehydrogenase FAD-binding subunit [Breoghania corrubedonensis]